MTKDERHASMAVRCVRALLDRHGFARYRQSAWLADAVGISYSQAHRRLNGASPWTLEDLAEVASKFGESLVELIASESDAPSAGILQIGPTAVRCRMWLGDREERPQPGKFVAVRTSSGWKAVQAQEAGEGPTYRVERIDIRPASATRKVIAVLDDDRDLANSITAHLVDSGYDARPFFRTADMAASVELQPYDAFVLDWIVGESNVLETIGRLRARDAAVPIVVLTAQVITGVVDEQEIAAAVQQHGLLFHEKPVRMSILSATLARALPSI